jgi:hypothetical protein
MGWFLAILQLIGWGNSYINSNWGQVSDNGFGKVYEELVTQWEYQNNGWENYNNIWT